MTWALDQRPDARRRTADGFPTLARDGKQAAEQSDENSSKRILMAGPG
jgi:hypothetical protein